MSKQKRGARPSGAAKPNGNQPPKNTAPKSEEPEIVEEVVTTEAPEPDLNENQAPTEAPEAAPDFSEPVVIHSKEEPASTKQAEGKSSKLMIVFGGAVLAFAVVGVIATVIFLSGLIGKVGSNTKLKSEYEWLITPVVLQDPPTFETPDKLTDTTIITAGVWRLIMNEDTSKYPTDQMNFISVPKSDIEVQIKALFGDVNYNHQSVGDTELMISYDEENKTYIFPAVPHVLAYTPEVQEIVKADDGKVVLTVGYIPPGLVWEGDINGNTYRPSAEKIMTYTLQETEKGAYHLYSVTGLDGGGNDFHNVTSGTDLGDMGSGAGMVSGVSDPQASTGSEPVEESQTESVTAE